MVSILRMVDCVVLKEKSEALEKPTHPGDLGVRIYENVSKEGWQQWKNHLTTLMNSNGLNTADVRALDLIEEHMLGYFFAEGDYGHMPAGSQPAGGGGGKK
jgi:Fe-S cluster biosynthesis and repair protein YggX